MSRDAPRPAVPFALVWIAGIAIGVVAMLYGQCDVREHLDRRTMWLPHDEGFVETDLTATLLATPETDVEGDTVLELRSDAGDRVRLRVYASVTGGTLPPDLLRGDVVQLWCRIGVPSAYRNPGYPPPSVGMYARGLDAIGSVKSPRLVRRIRVGASSPGRFIDRLRVTLRSRLDRVASGRERAVIAAMLLGDRAGLSSRDYRAVRRAGLAHVLAISGMHVSILLAVVAILLHVSPLPRGVRTVVLVGFLAGGAFLAGARPSILRAAVGAGTALAGRWIGRDGDAINTLALVATVLLVARPGWVLDAGFQLSFLATAGILWLVPRWKGIVPGPLAVSGAAYAATAPVVAWHFRALAPVALAANLIAVPLCGLVLVCGIVALATCDIPVIGAASAWLASHAAGWLLDSASWFGRWPGAAMIVPRPGLWLLVTWYGVLLAPRRIPGAAALLAIWLHLGAPPSMPAGIEVRMIDVGQGQSILVRGPHGGAVLIDAGGSASKRFDVGERVVVPVLADLGVRYLDAVIVTHRDIDHAGGVPAVMRSFDVGDVWDARLRRRTSRARFGSIELELLHPGPHDRDLSRNDRSIVVRIETPCGAAIVPGDLEATGEDRMIDSGVDPNGTLLIVGHHGAGDASSSRFLDAVGASHAGISAGRNNRFGHPDRAVLERLDTRDVAVRRSDHDGQVAWTCVHGRWQVEASAGDQ